jgi:putative tricarboxylic transport membrane protein
MRPTRCGAAALVALAIAACGGGADGGGGAESGGSGELRAGDFSIMAPADPGGGWDSTARALQQALDDSGVVSGNVEVYNRPGAGGTTGLAEFATDKDGRADELMVMGLVMIGAIETNDAPVGLDSVTPIASLTAEYESIVVPTGSEYETVEDLLADFEADPRSISWGGGSAGGTDHILVGLIAEATGADPSDINYIAHSGGGEALSSILSGGVTAGVSGISEFEDQVASGELRYLAVSSPDPIEGVDAPTLRSVGVDIELTNWRGLVAPAGISDAERDELVAMVDELVASDAWEDVLEANDWDSFVQVGDEFDAFLTEEESRVAAILERIGLT